jgi:hypothetical protein
MAIHFDDDGATGNGEMLGDIAAWASIPVTISLWAYPDIGNDYLWLAGMAEDSSNYIYLGLMSSGDGSNPSTLRLNSKENASSDNVHTTNTYDVTDWNHCIGIWTSSTSRTVVLNGDWANRGTSTTSKPNPTFAMSGIGGAPNTTTPTWQGARMDGDLAEIAVWDVALTQSETEALAAGAPPLLIRPASLVFYDPLYKYAATLPAIVNSTSVSLNTADGEAGNASTASRHPPVMRAASPFIIPAAAAAPAGTRPQNPLGHPFFGPFAGPIGT